MDTKIQHTYSTSRMPFWQKKETCAQSFSCTTMVGFGWRHSWTTATANNKNNKNKNKKKRSSNFLLLSLPLIVGSLVCAVRNFRAAIPFLQLYDPPSKNSVPVGTPPVTSIAAPPPPPDSSLLLLADKKRKQKQERTAVEDPDAGCPFRHSGLYRKVFVYPNYGDVPNGWKGSILSTAGAHNRSLPWPWLAYDAMGRQNHSFQYDLDGTLVQYSTELLVREILTNPQSCLRTYDPEEATLFYVPYLPSLERFGNNVDVAVVAPLATTPRPASPFAQAILDILDQHNYTLWENVWGFTSTYWSRNNGSDHILVFSEPLHGLYHPSGWRGNRHYIHTQKQLSPPIIVSVELSTTFVTMFPQCAAKNILMPYPNPDGRWFNGNRRSTARSLWLGWKNATNNNSNGSEWFWDAALPSEREMTQHQQPHSLLQRPLSQFYQAQAHGECIPLRKALRHDYNHCSKSSRVLQQWEKQHKESLQYSLAMQWSTFCPSPHGDSPSAKRMFDTIFAGCIPVVLSKDFVWPFTTDVHPDFTLNPQDFSLRLNATEYWEPALEEKTCQPKDLTKRGLESYLQSINASTIAKLRQGLAQAAHWYSYYTPSTGLPPDLLRQNILPTGGAAHMLVQHLADRQSGMKWPACAKELHQIGSIPDVRKFQC